MLLKLPVCTEEDVMGYYWMKSKIVDLPKPEDDTINYNIKKTIETEGYSGSPVYLLYESKIIFGGLLAACNNRDKWIMVLRPENVLKALKQAEKNL
jgi:hypothetical protein